jgi:hypothetical protein
MDLGSSSRCPGYKWNIDVGCAAKACRDLLSSSRAPYKCLSLSTLPAKVLRQFGLLEFEADTLPALPAERSPVIEFAR